MSAERRQAPDGGWGELTVDELKTELEARGLPKSGKKDELIARLDEDDASGTAEDAATTPEAQEASEDVAAAADADEEAAEEV